MLLPGDRQGELRAAEISLMGIIILISFQFREMSPNVAFITIGQEVG